MIEAILDWIIGLGKGGSRRNVNEMLELKYLKVRPMKSNYYFIGDQRFKNRRIRRIRK